MKIRKIRAFIATFFIVGGLSAFALPVEGATPAPDPVRLCAGATDGNYFAAGVDMKAQFGALVVMTTGGSWDNLTRLSNNECDAAIVQADALSLYKMKNPMARLSIERVGVLYQEYVHLIVNTAANIDDVEDLSPKTTVMVGAEGSGPWITFEAIALALGFSGEKTVPTLPLGGIRAFNKVKDGFDAQVGIFVTGLNSPFIKEINNYAVSEKKPAVVLASAWFNALEKIKDERGNPVYSRVTIPARTYPNLQPGVFSSVDTIGVSALLIVSTDFVEKNPEAYDRLNRAFAKAQPNIAQRMAPKK